MNCPKCGAPLRISKKDPSYGLCDTCKKRFQLPSTDEAVVEKPKKAKAEASNPEKKAVKKKSAPAREAASTKPAEPAKTATTSKKRPEQAHKKPKAHTQTGYYPDDLYEDEPHRKKKKYANIPPSKVRSSREDDMRSGYDELLSIENDKQSIGGSILTAVIIIVVLALIGGGVFFLYQKVIKGASSSKIDASAIASEMQTAEADEVIYEDDTIEVLI